MIISFILGGLGNQLFQFAVAKKISHTLQVPLKIETFGYNFKKYKKHPFCLDKFNINAAETRISDYTKLASSVFSHFPLVKEKSAAFDKNILNTKDNSFLIGYWHSEKYFNDISHIIRNDLTLKEPPSSLTREMYDLIQSKNSISIHVRRSDYVSNPVNAKIFETCSLEYYRNAVKTIAESVISPHFFIFSDDHIWAKENLIIDFPITYVTHNDIHHGYEDMIIMSKCKHQIIANSTFSWWGAWLNDNPDKIVISPKKWFKDIRYEEPDLIPENWIKL